MLASIFSVTMRWFSRIMAGLKKGWVCHSCWRMAIVDSDELHSSIPIIPTFHTSNMAVGGVNRGIEECFIVRAAW